MKKNSLFMILTSVLLTSCAGLLETKYQESSYSGGFYVKSLKENIFEITVQGNGFTSEGKIRDYFYYAAAECRFSGDGYHFILM